MTGTYPMNCQITYISSELENIQSAMVTFMNLIISVSLLITGHWNLKDLYSYKLELVDESICSRHMKCVTAYLFQDTCTVMSHCKAPFQR